MAGKTHTRYAQAAAVEHEGFRGLVKASLMVTAYVVLFWDDASAAGISEPEGGE